ncbi:MAG: hypothetical protein JO332_09820 [Planctomycetaceae bacterium]|nr:hypothetical protein [Planctomycetaceae bacterium]
MTSTAARRTLPTPGILQHSGRNRWSALLWLFAAHLLLSLAPAAGPAVNKAYGAFPLAGIVHVNASATLPPDGLSHSTGWRTIADGLKDAVAKGAGTVEVCDQSTYSEVVVMRDGISLISLIGGGLAAGLSGEDVLKICEIGSTQQPNGLPVLTTALTGAVVRFDGLKKATSLIGFRITGGVSIAGDGGGVLINKCANVSLITNCIDDNRATNGGGVAIVGSKNILLERNAIHDNNATSDGGGVSSASTHQLTCTGNFLDSNHATRSGGGIHASDSDLEEHNKEKYKSNIASEGFGGGGNHLLSKKVRYTDCTFQLDTAGSQGGGGLNLSRTPSVAVTGCKFELCSAGFANTFFSPMQLYQAEPGGGGVRVEGCDVDFKNSSFTECRTALDGGGVLIISKSTFPSVFTIDVRCTCTMDNCSFTSNHADDDGGGLSNQVGTFLGISNTTFQNNDTLKGGKGGGFHSTGKASTVAANLTFTNNRSSLDAGGAFVRSATLKISSSSFTGNSAASDAGGMQLLGSREKFIGGLVDYPVIDVESVLRCTSVSWLGNVATAKAGALHIKRFADTPPKSISFQVDANSFNGNQAAGTLEAVVRVSISNQPPKSQGRNRLKGCTFKNRGVQIEGDQSVTFVSDFYDIEDCQFDLTTAPLTGEFFPTGIRLFQDSPTIKGTASLFQGTDGTGPEGIVARSSAPEIHDAKFSKLGTGINGLDSSIVIRRCTFEDGFFGVFFSRTNGAVHNSTLQRNHSGITLVHGCVVTIAANNLFANNGTNVDTTGN